MKIKKNTYEIYSTRTLKKDSLIDRITIITVVYNGEETLEITIKNILNQDHKNIEYIIVYTPSNDKTFDIIKKYENKIDKILINFDIGIYQSMNLGTKFATGKYINFMNSGDFFYKKNIVSNLFKIKQKVDVLYGDCKVKYPNFTKTIRSSSPRDIKYKMFFSHQSSFIKSSIQKEIGFNVKYNLAADYDFFCKLIKSKKKFKKINFIISTSKAFGIVDIKQTQTLFESYKITSKIFKKEINFFKIFLLIKIFVSLITSQIKILLTKKTTLAILKLISKK